MNQSDCTVYLMFTLTADDDNPVKVVAHDSVSNWSALSASDTMSNIAFEVRSSSGAAAWCPPEGQEPTESFSLAQGAVDTYELQAKHGLAWASSLELEYVLMVRVKGE